MKYLLDGQQSERLLFRKIQEPDFDQWLAFFKDPRTSIHWVEARKSPEEECKRWYEKQFWRYENELGGMNALIEKTSGKLVGHSGLLVQTIDGAEELEIGYSLLPEFWNKGFALEAAKKCRDIAFRNTWAVSQISIISETNLPSQKVAVKNGMKKDVKTVYKENKVDIFRITRKDWLSIQQNIF
ncbi:MAG: GNAT family N-acetyltransferase [Bacteroidetes bacterium]|nr:GNAT family N-acetyltransferase [Bacteroidota bacterium]